MEGEIREVLIFLVAVGPVERVGHVIDKKLDLE